MRPQEHIRNSLKTALITCGYDVDDDRLLTLEKPKQDVHGDFSSPVAMNLARIAKQAPRKIAQQLVDHLKTDTFYIDKVEIAGPGFINFHLADACLQQSVLEILNKGEKYGAGEQTKPIKIQFEFVSANPTGPLNIVSARAAALGDVISRLWKAAGHLVGREYYVNDAGRQVRLLGASCAARYMTELGHDEEVPEDGYLGEYLVETARHIIAQEGDRYTHLNADERRKILGQKTLEIMLARHKSSLEKYRVQYDVWYRESTLRDKNAHQDVLDRLTSSGHTYEKDSAIWFRSFDFGDEKDRVLITSEGEPTYFLVDIAYHETKFKRGFDYIVDFWGPDHHGYIPRMSAALQALGHEPEAFEVGIIQQVNLLRNGEPVKMSKRAGEIIEMDELLDEVGVDAARYFFVDRRLSQPLDFDIELAKKQSDENPVYYVQYAHARICNVLRHARESGYTVPESADMQALDHPSEMAVVKKLVEMPDIIERAAAFMEPHRLTAYLQEVATAYHKFYHDCRIVTENQSTTLARLMLCRATRQVLANGFELLGISSPENM